MTQRRVKLLNAEVARKIAAGEVIDRPNAIIRELMDNAVDSGATRISVEIEGGGIEKIRIVDNGCGMSKEDLKTCAHPHATSKISTETDLLNLSTLGFRGEALASMAAVSRLQITSGGWRMNASVTEDHILTPCTPVTGTIVQTAGLFENFPARRQFLKRPGSEGTMCRSTFEEKALPRPDIEFSFSSDGEEKLRLPSVKTLKERFVQTMEFFETEDLFYQIEHKDEKHGFSFNLIIGEPSVSRSSRKDIYIYVNGRRIQEYSLIQAITYGTQGYFPNGTFPVACIFIEINPSLVDFNIHPAKREARFYDINTLHHAVSTATKDFFKKYTVNTMVQEAQGEKENLNGSLSFEESESVQDDFVASKVSSIWNRQTPVMAETRNVSFSTSHSKSENPSNRFSDSRTNYFSSSPKSTPQSISEHNESAGFNKNYIPDDFSTTEKYSEDFHFIGSALGTFILAEKNGTLFIIDQHAAHERILYNQIMAESSEKQELLVPYTVTADSAADDNYIRCIQEKLSACGFTCRDCGDGKWEFTSVPVRWKGNEADLKKDILDRRVSPADMINAVAASTACRRAVMDGTILDRETAAQIARQALELPDPHCPHGRPVFTSITRSQLFELVKRT